MSYDLDILVRGRKKIKPLYLENIRIDTNNKYRKRRYEGTFQYYEDTPGVRCFLYDSEEEKYLSAFNICDIKPADRENAAYPFWVRENERSGMYILTIRVGYEDTFRQAITYLWKQSPERSILFLPRLQGGEYNNVCGVITLERFFELLNSDKILFNIVYMIQD